MKDVGPVPGRVECRHAARAGACDGVIVRVLRDVVTPGNFGQHLLGEKARVAITERVVLIAAIVAALLVWRRRREHSGINEDTDDNRNVRLVNQVVEDNRNAPAPGLFHHSASVLKDHDASGLFRLVLCRRVDPVIAHGSGIDLARPGVFRHATARDAGLSL